MQNRRKTIVINKKFQHHYAIVLVAMTVLVGNLVILAGMLVPGEGRIHLSASAALFIGLAELVLVVGIWFLSLRSTHRIAGPVYVATRDLAAFGAGDLTVRIALRNNDMFKEEIVGINSGLEQLHGQVVQVKQAAAELQQAQASGGDVAGALEKTLSALGQLRTEAEA